MLTEEVELALEETEPEQNWQVAAARDISSTAVWMRSSHPL
jgi:hypothetical protein